MLKSYSNRGQTRGSKMSAEGKKKERDYLGLKCVYCEKEAKYVKDGMSFCEDHFKQYLQKMDCSTKTQQAKNRDIELQKIQVLQNDFVAWFNAGSSLWVGGLIGLLILILTLYYNKQLGLVPTVIVIVFVYAVLGAYGTWFMNKRSIEFFAFVDELLTQVEKGEPLGSLMEIRRQTRGKGKSRFSLCKRSS
jgi:uncharacterized membrane protein